MRKMSCGREDRRWYNEQGGPPLGKNGCVGSTRILVQARMRHGRECGNMYGTGAGTGTGTGKGTFRRVGE